MVNFIKTLSFIRVLDEGGMAWMGRRKNRTLDAMRAEAEAGVARRMRDEFGIADVA